MKGILNFIKSLFGRKEANEITTPQSSIKLVTMWEGGTKIQIDIDKIRFAFIPLGRGFHFSHPTNQQQRTAVLASVS